MYHRAWQHAEWGGFTHQILNTGEVGSAEPHWTAGSNLKNSQWRGAGFWFGL